MTRPSRAKMCSWLGSAVRNVRVLPTNPADIKRMVELGRAAQSDLTSLAGIADELGWHVDASLDYAWELIEEYENQHALTTKEN